MRRLQMQLNLMLRLTSEAESDAASDKCSCLLVTSVAFVQHCVFALLRIRYENKLKT